MAPWIRGFVSRLNELGWKQGQTVSIEYRYLEGNTGGASGVIGDFVRLKADVIVTYGTAAALAAKETTSVIPIVFAAAGDPVATGIVQSLARPEGNVTGISLQETDSGGKRLELLRQLLPKLERLAIIAHVGSTGAMREKDEVQKVALKLGLEVFSLEIRQAADIAPAMETVNGRAQALFVVTDPLMFANREQIQKLALAAGMPTVCNYREYVEAGCLMCYGPNMMANWRRAAEFTDKILRGAKPGEIPVEQPTKMEFMVNMKTAKALRLVIPQSALIRADAVIE